jgi:hypothetical protein
MTKNIRVTTSRAKQGNMDLTPALCEFFAAVEKPEMASLYSDDEPTPTGQKLLDRILAGKHYVASAISLLCPLWLAMPDAARSTIIDMLLGERAHMYSDGESLVLNEFTPLHQFSNEIAIVLLSTIELRNERSVEASALGCLMECLPDARDAAVLQQIIENYDQWDLQKLFDLMVTMGHELSAHKRFNRPEQRLIMRYLCSSDQDTAEMKTFWSVHLWPLVTEVSDKNLSAKVFANTLSALVKRAPKEEEEKEEEENRQGAEYPFALEWFRWKDPIHKAANGDDIHIAYPWHTASQIQAAIAAGKEYVKVPAFASVSGMKRIVTVSIADRENLSSKADGGIIRDPVQVTAKRFPNPLEELAWRSIEREHDTLGPHRDWCSIDSTDTGDCQIAILGQVQGMLPAERKVCHVSMWVDPQQTAVFLESVARLCMVYGAERVTVVPAFHGPRDWDIAQLILCQGLRQAGPHANQSQQRNGDAYGKGAYVDLSGFDQCIGPHHQYGAAVSGSFIVLCAYGLGPDDDELPISPHSTQFRPDLEMIAANPVEHGRQYSHWAVVRNEACTLVTGFVHHVDKGGDAKYPASHVLDKYATAQTPRTVQLVRSGELATSSADCTRLPEVPVGPLLLPVTGRARGLLPSQAGYTVPIGVVGCRPRRTPLMSWVDDNLHAPSPTIEALDTLAMWMGKGPKRAVIARIAAPAAAAASRHELEKAAYNSWQGKCRKAIYNGSRLPDIFSEPTSTSGPWDDVQSYYARKVEEHAARNAPKAMLMGYRKSRKPAARMSTGGIMSPPAKRVKLTPIPTPMSALFGDDSSDSD